MCDQCHTVTVCSASSIDAIVKIYESCAAAERKCTSSSTVCVMLIYELYTILAYRMNFESLF